MSDERKPVMCRFCGGEMVSSPARYFDGTVDYKYACEQCGIRTEDFDTMEEAYAAATRRPPNLPLDYKTIYNLTDREPVWRVDKQDDVIVLGGYNAWRKYDAVRYLYFAANPSPADIEAARAEKSEGGQ